MNDVLQTCLPYTPWSDPRLSRLPGMVPLDMADWIVTDEAFAGQMALRDRLITGRRAEVLQVDPSAEDAAGELLDLILTHIAAMPGYQIGAKTVRRPDGVSVPLDRADPLATAGRLVQEDLCLLQQRGDEHVLTGAVLCFPASWTLAEKFLRPLIGIHDPIASYDADIARRVQRLFDAIRPDRPLWRANAHLWDHATLFAPRPESDPRPPVDYPAPFLRSERQCLLRLADTGAVVFSIHTYLLRTEDLTPGQKDGLAQRVRPFGPSTG